MVIQIRLNDRIDHTREQIRIDSLSRAWCGYDPGVSDEVLWEHNRGRWSLKEDRIAQETHATFVHNGRVVAVYRIEGYERVDDPGPTSTKIALIGSPITSTDPLRELVGKPAVHRGRNAVNYIPDVRIVGEGATQSALRRAFLLTWNPDKWDWIDYASRVLDTARGGVVQEEWSTGGRTTGIHIGDLVFLLRQGRHGRGIIGSGQATDFMGVASPSDELVHTEAHWDGSGSTANYVDVEWNRLVAADDLLPIEELKAEFPEQNWSPMASGTQIRPDVVDALVAKWSSFVGGSQPPTDGQRYVADSARRKAIEDAAQDWLMQHHRDEGWTVHDTRYSGPYDAIATKDDQKRYLEAKGTQNSGEAVFVTRGEVEHARAHRGDCYIGIWSGMRFTGAMQIDPDAGEKVIMPFEPDTGILSALQYRWEWAAGNHD